MKIALRMSMTLFFCIALWLCVAPTAFADNIAINDAIFPDPVFQNYVSMNFDIDGNGELSESEINAVIAIDCSGTFSNPGVITSLQGIELFPKLRTLKCSYNCLTELDVCSNVALVRLECSYNRLTKLDVSKNAELQWLDVGTSGVYTDDGVTPGEHDVVYSNTYYSQINQLKELDVSHNPKLRELRCVSNQLTELDLSHNPALSSLNCDDNRLTALDVSHNSQLSILHCGNHPRTTNDNQLKELNLSNNPLLQQLECQFVQLTELDLSDKPELRILNCMYNQLSELDISKNTKLHHLDCRGNHLTKLDLSNNPLLWQLICISNQLTELDVRNNPALELLMCSENQLTELNVSNAKLRKLRYNGNNLMSLNISRCPLLVNLVDTVQPETNNDIAWYSSPNNYLVTDKNLVLFSSVDNSPDFVLPDSLTVIGENAFEGGAFTIVRLSDTTEKIQARAFANCPKIAFIIVPPATTDIAWDAFDGDKGLTILGAPESRAETYAAERGLRFAALP